MIQPGDDIRVWWFTGRENNMAQVIEVLPYTGRYPEYFNCVLRLPAPNTRRGWLEMAYDSREKI